MLFVMGCRGRMAGARPGAAVRHVTFRGLVSLGRATRRPLVRLVIRNVGILVLLSFTASSLAQTICFAFQDLETEFWVAGHLAMTRELAERGVSVLERNAQEDANRQLEQVRDCIAQGVDRIILIPQDGESAVTIVREAQDADTPIAVFNRPPSDLSRGIVIVADNESIAEQAVDYMVELAAERFAATGQRLTPVIMVGDLGDPNAVGRRQGFYNAINKRLDLFNPVIEVGTEWDAATGFANLEAAITANPAIDFLFTSSDFLFPTIRAILEPRGKWVTRDDANHVIMGGLDGDATACLLIKEGFVDATGVQDLFFEADMTMDALLAAIAAGDAQPNQVIEDPGFALTAGNIAEREMDMWGCVLLEQGFLD
jgi:ABC-type sugar transport system substrate-binding protein